MARILKPRMLPPSPLVYRKPQFAKLDMTPPPATAFAHPTSVQAPNAAVQFGLPSAVAGARAASAPSAPYLGYESPAAAQARINAEMQAGLAPAQAYYQKLQADEQARATARAQLITSLYGQLAQSLGGAGTQVQDIYRTAAADQSSFAKGFSDGQRLATQASAEQANKLVGIAGVGQTVNPEQAGAAANVLYGVGGYIPASTLTREGAAFGAAASFLPSAAAGAGRQEIANVLGQSAQAQQGFSAELARLEAERPALYQQALREYHQQQTQLQAAGQARQDRLNTAAQAQANRQADIARAQANRRTDIALHNADIAKAERFTAKRDALAWAHQRWQAEQQLAQTKLDRAIAERHYQTNLDVINRNFNSQQGQIAWNQSMAQLNQLEATTGNQYQVLPSGQVAPVLAQGKPVPTFAAKQTSALASARARQIGFEQYIALQNQGRLAAGQTFDQWYKQQLLTQGQTRLKIGAQNAQTAATQAQTAAFSAGVRSRQADRNWQATLRRLKISEQTLGVRTAAEKRQEVELEWRMSQSPKKGGFTQVQKLGFRATAETLAGQAFNGIRDPKNPSVMLHPPLTYQQAIAEARKEAIPTSVAISILNKYYKPGQRGRPYRQGPPVNVGPTGSFGVQAQVVP